MNINILLYCRHSDNLIGNFLFFETIRVGFPAANINVYSNANSVEFNELAIEKCKDISANFYILNEEVTHWDFIAHHIVIKEKEPFYIIDPDTVWYEKMPTKFPSSLAGRFIPKFYDVLTDTNTYERLHTSCLYIDPLKLLENFEDFSYIHEFDPISPSIFYDSGLRYRHDTTSKLYNYLSSKGDATVFTDEIDDKFAHLFCGTHLDVVTESYPQLKDIYNKVIVDKSFAKFLKKDQDSFFAASPWKTC